MGRSQLTEVRHPSESGVINCAK